jgi:hypothetical protein
MHFLSLLSVNEPRKSFEKDQKELLETKRKLREAQDKLERTEKEMGEIRPDCTCGIKFEWRIFRIFICGSKQKSKIQ